MFQPFFGPLETWAYDVDQGTWENRHPLVEPPGRFGSMMVYDPRADRVLLFGGTALADGTGLSDLWAYDYERNTWTERHPAVSPPPHHFPALVYVPTIDRTILFGGYNPSDGSLLNDTWAYDYHRNRWTNLHPRHAPAPRMAHYMAFEPRTNRLVMFGGFLATYSQATNDTWIYHVATNRWSQVFPKESPGPRAWHVMSRTNGPVVLFGGGPDQPGFTNETFLYTSRSNTWTKVSGGVRRDRDRDDDRERSIAIASMTGGRQLARQGPAPDRR
jgi:N-acetylneuraminic acid mutarotase